MKVKFNLSIGYSGANRSEVVEFPDCIGMSQDEWDALTADEQESEIALTAQGWANNYIEVGFAVVDGGE